MLVDSNVNIQGELVRLRFFKESDREFYKEMMSDSETMHALLYLTKKETGGWTDEDLDKRLEVEKKRNNENTGFSFIIADIETDEFIGTIGTLDFNQTHKRTEIGLITRKKYWRRGVGKEATSLLLKLCFEKLDVNRVQATTFAHNTPTRVGLELMGFELEGLCREKFLEDGVFRDDTIYALLKRDWIKNKKS